ncbi:Protein-tyrosine phosphatase-like PTPLA [Penicillium capsulatum]|uniref:Very-long-chain (3R)-3-hydroxyacyl-CoA dehydratase n=1 Tax=Penicillium capsulatum TaxID=69766 RepID=A0A9W9HRC3_9EURO|nr:Protein-tyrosine phosphatase-like PTPLA [Penicillium capsulatum]KAJ6105418.1 Protein-tyrosine phosphatase-like PTPLA [Penicillium capsulatum]
MALTSQASAPRSGPSGLTRVYLFAYNAFNLLLWGSCVVYTASLLPDHLLSDRLPAIFNLTSQLLLATQSLALLEVLHSVVGLVRAPFLTTAMQVASRLLVVWGILAPFGGDIAGAESTTQLGDYAYLGCVGAWGITEVIRYGFFAITLSGNSVPAWWTWLRYNTFYVLYPIGITSECTLIFQALRPAAEINPLFQYFLIAVLVIYVPGSYVLYTHMIAQRRKVLRGKKRAD